MVETATSGQEYDLVSSWKAEKEISPELSLFKGISGGSPPPLDYELKSL